MKFKAILLLFLLFPITSVANCDLFSEDLPILEGGRVKPYFVFAKEGLKYMTGKSKLADQKPIHTICEIYKNNLIVNFPIQHSRLRTFLEVENSIPADSAGAKLDYIKAEYLQQKLNDSYKKALKGLLNKTVAYNSINSGNAFSIYINHQDKNQWAPVSMFNSEISLKEHLKKSKELYIADHGDTFLTELSFSKSHLFSWAMLLALISIFVIVLSKKLAFYHFFVISTLIIQVVGIALRVIISGRAPITNMYETVLFSGFGALFIAYIIFLMKKDKIYLIGGLGYNILCLFMMMFANNMLTSSISPLVPVLRDNFWLSTHVTCVILSYAALALSWIIANITLFKLKFAGFSNKDLNHHFELIYNCIKIGVVLLAAGIILGGVWADYSWGRFWGWDPKETWSLIVLLFYMAILHGRYSNWINNKRFVLLSAGGFMTVMMAWFGVNYILASGLHSYGFSEGGAIFLGSFFAIQTGILIFGAIDFTKGRAS